MHPVLDSLKSFIGNLGNPNRDKAASVYFTDVNLTDRQLSIAYKNSWMVRKIINLPAEDSLRKWRTFEDKSDEIEAEEKRLNLKSKMSKAIKRGRLNGCGVIMIGIKNQEVDEEIDVEGINKGDVEYLTVLKKSEITPHERERDPQSPNFGYPNYYRINNTSVMIHHTRLIIFRKEEIDFEENYGSNQDWADSVLKPSLKAITDATSTYGNVASLVFEASVDVVKMPNMMKNMGKPAEREKMLKRFTLAAQGKGVNGTLMIDGEEDYQRKQVTFTQLPEVMKSMILAVPASANIPATKFLGKSADGMNATGEGDSLNYYDMLSTEQELNFTPALAIFDKCLLRSAGFEEDIPYNWNPIRQSSEKELSDIGKVTVDSIEKLGKLGDGTAFSSSELREIAVNKLSDNNSFPQISSLVGTENSEVTSLDTLISGGHVPEEVIYNKMKSADMFKDTDIKTFNDYKLSLQND